MSDVHIQIEIHRHVISLRWNVLIFIVIPFPYIICNLDGWPHTYKYHTESTPNDGNDNVKEIPLLQLVSSTNYGITALTHQIFFFHLWFGQFSTNLLTIPRHNQGHNSTHWLNEWKKKKSSTMIDVFCGYGRICRSIHASISSLESRRNIWATFDYHKCPPINYQFYNLIFNLSE